MLVVNPKASCCCTFQGLPCHEWHLDNNITALIFRAILSGALERDLIINHTSFIYVLNAPGSNLKRLADSDGLGEVIDSPAQNRCQYFHTLALEVPLSHSRYRYEPKTGVGLPPTPATARRPFRSLSHTREAQEIP